MGLIQSIMATNKAATNTAISTSDVTPTSVADKSSNTVESQSSTEPVKAVELVKEQTNELTIVKETIDEVKPDQVKPDETVPKTPNSSSTVTVADNISANERYVTPVGTKVEVAPVNVTPNADVVKKNKKHKKNKN